MNRFTLRAKKNIDKLHIAFLAKAKVEPDYSTNGLHVIEK